ncbi:ATP-binding cassette domain-containing protein [Virgibacillus litoralis]|uniref:Molybdate transport system ATP-binding protein n=1 Tax=Virgibacillus litoralis TaxID=578221 RepID=A0ABS4HFD3_9BACI|nr:ATP-binding cassette domain-containing protein [Virgibacillus litoralis]MBP1949444.1 molybdate transport system ATP-binding protein [Virgibacillus litoralis]
MLSLKIKKILKAYTLHAVLNVSEEITVLTGPSGAGKTTTLNCISGLIHPDSGEIVLNDRVLFQEKEKPIPVQKRNIGYVFQDYALFPHMTIRGNINYRMKDIKLVNTLVNVVGIEHILESYPAEISGGEKQRVALVRALATKPEALLLDEPFSSLDDETKEECQQELLRLHAMWKIPIIMVTHDLKEAERLGDRILRIEQGKIIDN